MACVLVTGACGLVGSETVRVFTERGYHVVGVDNDMRKYFFGDEGSTVWNRELLREDCPDFVHYETDIRDYAALERVFLEFGSSIECIIHTAAQPSHDWAARDPFTDFSVNVQGTLNLLELTRLYCPDAAFVYTSTNKVYGDAPNRLPLVEGRTRWQPASDHPYAEHGIDESMSIDQCLHSIFGADKLAADVLVQEYGRYFGMKTVCFRAGCITGPNHAGTQLHGFLNYLMRCAVAGRPYTIFGYKGKQVRDNIHAHDLAMAFHCFCQSPRRGEVYNIGGGPQANCSVVEAIEACERRCGRKMDVRYVETNRIGDHIWWVSDVRRFRQHYPAWRPTYDMERLFDEVYEGLAVHPVLA